MASGPMVRFLVWDEEILVRIRTRQFARVWSNGKDKALTSPR